MYINSFFREKGEKKRKKVGLKAGLINNINYRDFGKIGNLDFGKFWIFGKIGKISYYLLLLLMILPINDTLIF